jgi:hypothetical protein
MDVSRFDRLTRLLAAGSRRQIVGFLGGVITSQAAIRLDDTKAKKKKKKCKHGEKHCGSKRKCFDLQSDPKHCGNCGTVCGVGEACVLGQCVIVGPGDCPGTADSCDAGGTVGCGDNSDCSCFQRLEGGVRCVQFLLPFGACDQCETDADCVDLGFPPDSSCIKDDGPTCECLADDKGFCGEPCGFVPEAERAG